MNCIFENDKFIFYNDSAKITLPTKDDEGNLFRPTKNLNNFYGNLVNRNSCEMDFDLNDFIITIKHPDCDNHSFRCECVKNIEFILSHKDVPNIITMSILYEECIDSIYQFLKQFQFVI